MTHGNSPTLTPDDGTGFEPKVSIVDGRTIRIGYPRAFCKNAKQCRDPFLKRCFLVEEVISIEVEEDCGYALIRLRQSREAVTDAMMNLSAKLIAPLDGESDAGSGTYIELMREGACVRFARAPRQLSGIGRWVYQCLGCGFLGLSVLGVASPFLPTTPFVLISSYFFVRSCPALNRWLLESRLFGPILQDWYRFRAMRRSLRGKLLTIMVAVLTLTIALAGPSSPALPIMLLVSVVSFSFVMQIPVIDDAGAEGAVTSDESVLAAVPMVLAEAR